MKTLTTAIISQLSPLRGGQFCEGQKVSSTHLSKKEIKVLGRQVSDITRKRQSQGQQPTDSWSHRLSHAPTCLFVLFPVECDSVLEAEILLMFLAIV